MERGIVTRELKVGNRGQRTGSSEYVDDLNK